MQGATVCPQRHSHCPKAIQFLPMASLIKKVTMHCTASSLNYKLDSDLAFEIKA